jgi:hypothetical protein
MKDCIFLGRTQTNECCVIDHPDYKLICEFHHITLLGTFQCMNCNNYLEENVIGEAKLHGTAREV